MPLLLLPILCLFSPETPHICGDPRTVFIFPSLYAPLTSSSSTSSCKVPELQQMPQVGWPPSLTGIAFSLVPTLPGRRPHQGEDAGAAHGGLEVAEGPQAGFLMSLCPRR